jgi:ligand-binding sensor domain-containing protein
MKPRSITPLLVALLTLLTGCGDVSVRIQHPAAPDPTADALATENAQMATQVAVYSATVTAKESAPAEIVPRPPQPGWTSHTTADGLASNYINDIAVAPDGTVWVGTYQGGVSHFDGANWVTYTGGGLPCDDVNGIAVAPNGVVWAGTSCGIAYFDGQTWTTYHDIGSIDRRVLAITVAPNGYLWFGTLSGSVGRVALGYDPDHNFFHEFFIMDGLAAGELYAIAASPDGTVWTGGRKGLFRLKPRTMKWTHIEEWGYYRIYDIAVASDDEVWFATDADGGASQYGRCGGSECWYHRGLSDKDVTAIAVAPDGAPSGDGAVWAGRNDGIFGPFGDRWENHSTEDGLISNNVRAIAVAPDGKVWIGTDDGISCYDPY